jgi:hypothetical protein
MAKKPKPDRFSNPLLTEPEIHPDLKPLFDAMTMVLVWSRAIARCYSDMLEQKETHGLPRSDEWPDSPALERRRAQHAEWARATRDEEGVTVADFLEPRWTALMREWSGYYRDWCAAIAKAKELAKSPVVAAIMDAGESRPAHRWTTRAIIDLDNLAGTLHPIRMGGDDGLGFIRCGLPPLPEDFHTHAESVRNRIGELCSIQVSAVPPTPTASGGNGGAATRALPARTEVVLWEGAAHTDRNIRLARTRTAYLEAHGKVSVALAALKEAGYSVARSTFYNHLNALDMEIPRWRDSVQLSNPPGNLDGMRNVGTRRKSWGKVR